MGTYTFSNGRISIGFGSVSAAIPPYIKTYINPYNGDVSYNLHCPSGSKFEINANEQSIINKITFNGSLGGMALDYYQPGELIGQTTRVWSNVNDEDIASVGFIVNAQPAEITLLKVNYTEPAAILLPISSSIANGATVDSFKTFNIVFDRNIYVNNKSQIVLAIDGVKKDFALTTSNNVATFSLSEIVTKDCKITINVPTSSFRDTEKPFASIEDADSLNIYGYENAAFSYSFSVYAPRNTFNYATADPSVGIIEKLPPIIRLDFDKGGDGEPMYNVKRQNLSKLILFKNDEPYCNVSVLDDPQVKSIVNFKLEVADTITAPGTYTLTIPEKTIYNTFTEPYDRWNPEIVLTYIIEEPKPDPEPEPTEALKMAKELIANEKYMGIGYPTATSASRIALQKLVDENTQSNDSIDALLLEAIGNFYNERNVVMPEAGKWYTIMGVNAGESPKTIYLSYDGQKVSLSGIQADAVAFEVSYDGENILFRTSDDKYLHVLTNSSSYEGTTPANITSGAPDTFNKLNLRKLAIEDVDSTKTFGKFTLSGLLGFNDALQIDSSQVAINYVDTTIVDVPTHELFYNEEKSSALLLTETKNPTRIIPNAFLESTVLENDNFTTQLIFTNVSKVKLVDVSRVFVKNYESASDAAQPITADAILTKAENSDSIFVFHVNGLDGRADTLFYELVIPADAFDYSENPLTVEPRELRIQFRIKGYNYNYNAVSWLESIERVAAGFYYISDTDLNEFTLFSRINAPYSGLVADPTKEVTLVSYKVIRKGHFEPYPEFSQIYPNGSEYQAIKLVFDTPFVAGELQYEPGNYTYNVYKGTYGDLNFGRYLEDYTSVDKYECFANRATPFPVHVDNEKAAANGIRNIRQGESETVTYDLLGRKVTTPTKPGVYVVNGMKRIVK